MKLKSGDIVQMNKLANRYFITTPGTIVEIIEITSYNRVIVRMYSSSDTKQFPVNRECIAPINPTRLEVEIYNL